MTGWKLKGGEARIGRGKNSFLASVRQRKLEIQETLGPSVSRSMRYSSRLRRPAEAAGPTGIKRFKVLRGAGVAESAERPSLASQGNLLQSTITAATKTAGLRSRENDSIAVPLILNHPGPGRECGGFSFRCSLLVFFRARDRHQRALAMAR